MLRLANNYPIENQFIARYPAAITVIFNSKCHTIQMVNRFHVLNAAINNERYCWLLADDELSIIEDENNLTLTSTRMVRLYSLMLS